MIRALITGTLYGDPQVRTSQASNPFTVEQITGDYWPD